MAQSLRVPTRTGFSLLELLVAIAIIGVLVGLLFPAISAIKASATAANCKSNLRQCIAAHQAYGNDNKGYVPLSSCNNPQLPWFTTISPYLDRRDVMSTDVGGGAYKNAAIVSRVTQCAALGNRIAKGTTTLDPGTGYCRNPFLYYGNAGPGNSGVDDWDSSTWPTPFKWSAITFPGNRLLIGDGWAEGSGNLEATYWKQGATVASMGYFYNHVWSTAYAKLQLLGSGSGVKSPDRINLDYHRGNRSYGMCDGSVRSLSDDYSDSNNQAWRSVSNPSSL